MAKHTPGPWKIEESDYGEELWFGGEGCGIIYVNGWANGGCKGSPDRWKQLQANARLIAAAPDLLEALVAVLQWIDDYCETTGFDAVEAQADAALAKATGEQQ